MNGHHTAASGRGPRNYRRFLLSALLASAILGPAATPVGAQVLYVHRRVGCDCNSGTAPGAGNALQSITMALAIAHCNPAVRWTINVAGAASGGVVPTLSG
jgi:hypothetical protein